MSYTLNSTARNRKSIFSLQLFHVLTSARATLIVVFLIACLLITACKKNGLKDEGIETQLINAPMSASKNTIVNEANNVVTDYSGISWQTKWELQQARAATARYRNIDNAIKDGYSDINVVVQNMGYHYMNASLLDGTFDVRNPEILVYNKNEDGSYTLVAVEYAVPLTASITAPKGFTGSADVWDRNTVFELWLLHAWVWSFNPRGVFNSTNPNVHLH